MLPRTTGCTLRRPEDANALPKGVKLLVQSGSNDSMPNSITSKDKKYCMSTLFESTANDIFRKFDMLLNRELGFLEFKGFCDCVGKEMSEGEFNEILNKFSSTK